MIAGVEPRQVERPSTRADVGTFARDVGPAPGIREEQEVEPGVLDPSRAVSRQYSSLSNR